MNRRLSISLFLLLIFSLTAQEQNGVYTDDVSRLEILGFNYFPTPLPLTPGRLIDRDGRTFLINGETNQVLILVFMSSDDPFSEELRISLNELSEYYREEPFKIIIVSSAEEDFKDRNGRSADKWGVMNYPTILIADHNFHLRGSSEGIYPDFASEDFKKVIDRLLLDIHSPGIINTLQ